MSLILKGKNKELVELIESIVKKGKNINKFIEEIMFNLKEILLCKKTVNKLNVYDEIVGQINEEQIYLMIDVFNKLLIDIKFSSNQVLLLEVCVLQLVDKLNAQNILNNNKKEDNKFSEGIVDGDAKKEICINVDVKNEQNVSAVDVENLKKVRINNAFALADKQLLNNAKEKWHIFDSFLLDKKFGVVAGLLLDSNVVVVGKKNIIVVSKANSTVNRINNNLLLVSDLCFCVFEQKYDVIALDDAEWKAEKQLYVNNYKKNVNYVYIDELPTQIKNNKVVDSSVSELIDMFGTDIIEYK